MKALLLFLPALLGARTVSLQIYPPEIRLESGARQTVVVIATDDEGVARDATSEVKLGTGPAAAVDGNAVKGLEPGSTELTAALDGVRAAIKVAVTPATHRPLSFVNDISPIFTKSDCANSNCHGSVRGQKGFKLSLFGDDPELDYHAITKQSDGRRINRTEPAQSLVLQKPAMAVPHGGGQRFKVGSPEYALILKWLELGAPYDKAGLPRLTRLDVYPRNWRAIGIGSRVQVVAVGTYGDGTTRDLTSTVAVSSNIPAIAAVKPGAVIQADLAGETAIMVRTAGKTAAVPFLVVKDRPIQNYPQVARNNFIDEQVFRKLREVNVIPSVLCTDEEFIRRASLDVTGLVPTVEQTKAFLTSKDPAKRAKLVDALLERPERADLWAMRLADMYRAGYNEAGQKGGGAYFRWFRDQMRRNVRYDEMVRQLLVSQGRHDFEGISNFYFVSRDLDPEEAAVNVTQLLLGQQIECARCHNHPFERWTQDDFYGFSAFFARVERKDMYLNNHNATFLKDQGEVIHPKTKKVMVPKYLDGDFEPEQPGTDVRRKLAVWVTRKSNPWFARASVNRFWKFYMGRGIVEPVDDFRISNPPSNDALLQALADDFAAHGFDLKHLERMILNSRAYQLSSVPNETNGHDTVNYSHFIVRRLMAEQIMDSMMQITGIPEKMPSMPMGVRAMSVGVLPPLGRFHPMLKTFGRIDLREVICERDHKPSVAQVMNMVNGATFHNQATGKGGVLDQWIADGLPDADIVERFYLAALSRRPEADELQAVLKAAPGGRRQAFEDMLWALFNSKEFIYQH